MGLARWPVALAFLLLAGAWAYEGLRPLADLDVWWHITLGELIVQTGTLVPTEPFSFTQADQPWPYKDWGTALLLFGVFETGGLTGLVLLKAAMLIGTGSMIAWWLARQRRVPAALAVLVTALCVEAASFRFTERGATVSLVIITAVVLLIERHRQGKSGLVWVVALTVINANIHRGVLFVPVLMGALAGVELLETFVLRRGPAPRWRVSMLVAIGSGLACLATPFGISIITTTITLMGQHTPLITEWAPVQPWLVARLTPASFGVMALCTAALLVQVWKGRAPWDVALLLLALALGLQSMRHLPYLALLSAGPIGSALARSQTAWTGRLRHVIALGSAGAAVAMVLARPLPGPSFSLAPAHFPEKGVKFVQKLPDDLSLRGRMLNEFGYGGFLIANLWPEHRVYIDGRTDLVYPPQMVERYVALTRDPKVFAQEVKRWGIEWVLVDNAPPKGTFAFLDTDPNWTLVHASRRALIYVRTKGANEPLAKHRGYRWLWPHGLLQSLDAAARKGHLPEAMAELRRMLAEDPDNIYAAAAKAQVAQRLAQIREQRADTPPSQEGESP